MARMLVDDAHLGFSRVLGHLHGQQRRKQRIYAVKEEDCLVSTLSDSGGEEVSSSSSLAPLRTDVAPIRAVREQQAQRRDRQSSDASPEVAKQTSRGAGARVG